MGVRECGVLRDPGVCAGTRVPKTRLNSMGSLRRLRPRPELAAARCARAGVLGRARTMESTPSRNDALGDAHDAVELGIARARSGSTTASVSHGKLRAWRDWRGGFGGLQPAHEWLIGTGKRQSVGLGSRNARRSGTMPGEATCTAAEGMHLGKALAHTCADGACYVGAAGWACF